MAFFIRNFIIGFINSHRPDSIAGFTIPSAGYIMSIIIIIIIIINGDWLVAVSVSLLKLPPLAVEYRAW